jgi:hypothetical protein
MNHYKGIFYNQETEKKYYEGGAHFKYSDLVRELEKLIEKTQMNNKVNYLMNSNSQKSVIKSEGNKFKEIMPKENKLDKLLTLNNYKDIIIYNNKNIKTKENSISKKMLKKINILELIEQNFKLFPIKNSFYNNKYFYCKNSIDDNFNKNRTFKITNNINKTNDNIKLVTNKKTININNKLPLIESSYFKKFDNKNSLYLNKDSKNNFNLNINYISKLNKFKSNFQKENKIFTPKRNINIVSDKNSIFSFKSSDIYKNKKNLDTIDTLSNRKRIYTLGKIGKYFSTKKYKNNKQII